MDRITSLTTFVRVVDAGGVGHFNSRAPTIALHRLGRSLGRDSASGHRRTPFRLSNPLRRYRRGPDSPKRNHSFDTNVPAFLGHRTLHE